VNARILVVDDEPDIVDPIRYALEREGFSVEVALDGETALERGLHEPFDVVVLDVLLPRRGGFDVCRELRAESDVPIILLTARDDEIDRVLGLELGADDYVSKPFSLRELMARIRAVLRRPGPRQKFEEFAFGSVRVHLRARQAFKGGHEVRLTRKEFDLLRYLVEHPGEVITRDRLLDEVWGYERFPTTRTVDTHILRLRQKFEDDPERPVHILTAHGQGYRFVAEKGAP
jgi:two-component system alkaline phosphatase synthesis response regulator PhoP